MFEELDENIIEHNNYISQAQRILHRKQNISFKNCQPWEKFTPRLINLQEDFQHQKNSKDNKNRHNQTFMNKIFIKRTYTKNRKPYNRSTTPQLASSLISAPGTKIGHDLLNSQSISHTYEIKRSIRSSQQKKRNEQHRSLSQFYSHKQNPQTHKKSEYKPLYYRTNIRKRLLNMSKTQQTNESNQYQKIFSTILNRKMIQNPNFIQKLKQKKIQSSIFMQNSNSIQKLNNNRTHSQFQRPNKGKITFVGIQKFVKKMKNQEQDLNSNIMFPI